MPLPFFEAHISAGFPSPAADYLEDRLDLNELIIRHPAATFFVQVEGESTTRAGIHSDDTLVVDQVNAAWGRGALRQARKGPAQTWCMRQGKRPGLWIPASATPQELNR